LIFLRVGLASATLGWTAGVGASLGGAVLAPRLGLEGGCVALFTCSCEGVASLRCTCWALGVLCDIDAAGREGVRLRLGGFGLVERFRARDGAGSW
jgi:hypothetical protein